MDEHRWAKHRAYTILEVVIVLGLISILAAIGWFGYAAVVTSTEQSTVVATAESIDRGLRAQAAFSPDMTFLSQAQLNALRAEVVADFPGGYSVSTFDVNRCVSVVSPQGVTARITYPAGTGLVPGIPGLVAPGAC